MLSLGNAPASAPYPASMFPASSFFGAVGLQPGGAGAASDTKQQTSPLSKRHTIVTILAMIVGGYLLYHFNYKD